MNSRAHPIATSFFLCAFVSIARLAEAAEGSTEPGFTSLFDGKDISAHFVIKGNPASWKTVEGRILSTPGGDRIVSKKTYGDFVLRLDFKVSKNGNSGVFFRVPSIDDGDPWVTGFEAQISNEPRDDSHCTGSLYGVEAVKKRPDESDGVWHSYEIISLGERIRIRVDGVETVDASAARNEAIRKRPLRGHMGLQDSHAGPGSTIEYRNIRIQELRPDGTAEGFRLLSADGKGWHKIRSGHGTGGRWTFADGTWTGEQDPPGSGNGGINVTDEVFGDFELIIEARPDWGCDSGVFLRSTGDGRCYQVLVDYYRTGNIGGIFGEGSGGFNHRSYSFDEKRGAVVDLRGDSPLPFETADWPKLWRDGEFNEIRARIRKDPPEIEVWVGGRLVTRFIDTEKRLPTKGHIGIQVHGGGAWPAGAAVRYRSIQVREL